MQLSEDYIVSKFYQYAGNPKYNKLARSYFGGCPTCREGKSWGRKRRLYYVVKKDLIFCHNCGLSMRPFRWIMSVADLSYSDVLKENSEFIGNSIMSAEHLLKDTKKETVLEDLPTDSIDLTDKTQVSFYKDNEYVIKALEIIRDRRLHTAINRPKKYFISLVDRVHKNRLIIPFYDTNNKIIHYQSRTIVEKRNIFVPRYLSKIGSEKSLFGINNVKDDLKYIFITEGPLDSCFIKNGIAIAGINESRGDPFTDRQAAQLKAFIDYKKIWVLDNQHIDKASKKKTLTLAKQDQTVFIWPEELRQFKDINEMCIYAKKDSVGYNFILKNSYSGLKAVMMLSKKD